MVMDMFHVFLFSLQTQQIIEKIIDRLINNKNNQLWP